MEPITLTRAEQTFRLWMRISVWTYALGVVVFLLFGAHIPAIINAISDRILPLPLYPLPAETSEAAFWRVLSVSMMAMLTLVCRIIYKDVRNDGRLVSIVLLSKFCSTAVYCALFLGHGYLAYLVGALTDGPLFLVTFALWFQASPHENCITRKEQEILAALGDAFLPQGSALEVGYLDLRDACLADAERMFAAQDAVTRVATRVALHALDLAPIVFDRRLRKLCAMPRLDRTIFLSHLESRHNSMLKIVFLIGKLFVFLPFFNQPEANRAVGYSPESTLKP